MNDINIRIDLTELWSAMSWDREEAPPTLAEALVKTAAAKLLDALNRDEVMYELRNRVRDITNEAIREAITPLIHEAIGAAIQPTDPYGNPKGTPTTLAEVITKTATDALRKPQSSNGYQRDKTLMQTIIEDEVKRTVGAELRKAMDEAKEEVKAAVRQQGADILTEAITRSGALR